MNPRHPLLVAIVGPTASGKTALSLAIAERFGGEIVNCDSVAVYRDFHIGTAKPAPQERARAPHHLLDLIEPTRVYNAGDYARDAREVLAQIGERKRIPIVVGGTGLYLRALLEGLFAGPPRSQELRDRLNARAAARGSPYLHRMLARLDRKASAVIHENDQPKIVRAIEVCLTSREPMSDLWQRGRDPLRGFRPLRLGLDPERNALYSRINQRAARMFDAGLVEETRAIVEKYGDSAYPLGSLGYRQVMQFLRGEVDRKTAVWAAQQAHRNYAKRQLTWFRREPGVHWLKGFGDDPLIQQQALELVSSNL